MVSEREGNAEETHLAPDVQVNSVVFPKTPETRHSRLQLTLNISKLNINFIPKTMIFLMSRQIYTLKMIFINPLCITATYNYSTFLKIYNFDCKRIYASEATSMQALGAKVELEMSLYKLIMIFIVF